jgi:uncharacterized pyridoxamine 5'-phosphate oxidase family protein
MRLARSMTNGGKRIMRKTLAILATMLCTTLATGIFAVGAAAAESASQDIVMVRDFLKKCGAYYLATMDGDQPRVRPFGSLAIFEGKLYFQTGKRKDVSKQMAMNPRIEICAYDGKKEWVRIEATAVNDDRREAKQFMLDANPSLKSMYSADDDNTQVLYMQHATARFYAFGSNEPRVVRF